MIELAVIGGGPAGLTAALYAARAGRSVAVFEGSGFGGQITLSPLVENYPGLGAVSGMELGDRMYAQKERAVRVSFDPLYPAEGQLCPGRFRLGIHPVSQFHAADRTKTGIILHQRREGDLPAKTGALKYGNGVSSSCGIQGGCQSGRTAADHSKLDHWAYSRRNALIWAAPT